MNNIKFISPKRILSIILTAWLGVGCVTALAQKSNQTFEKAYENALLDSLVRYELLKPTYYTLTKSHEYLNKESLQLRAQSRLLQLQLDMQKRYYEGLLAVERKRRRKSNLKAFGLGFLAGKLTPPY